MNYLVSLLLLCGALFTLLSAIGILRFPDFYTRLHAVTKAGAFGGVMILLAAGLHFWTIETSVVIFLNIIFFYFTAPVAAHMIAKSAHLQRVTAWRNSGEVEPSTSNLSRRRLDGLDEKISE